MILKNKHTTALNNRIMIRSIFLTIIVFVAMISIFSCNSASARKPDENQKNIIISKHAGDLINIIKIINNKSPKYISANVYIEASIKNKKYKTNGQIILDKNTSLINLKLQDYVFKSPIFLFYGDKTNIYFYYPAEKQLLVDSASAVRISDYTEVDIDYNLIKSVGYHEIPLILNYKIIKSVNDEVKKENYLMLDNKTHYQTIYFSKNSPQKVLIINKNSKEKYEIHFEGYTQKDDTGYFKKIKILSSEKKIKIEISINNPLLNTISKAKQFDIKSIPADVKRHNMAR